MTDQKYLSYVWCNIAYFVLIYFLYTLTENIHSLQVSNTMDVILAAFPIKLIYIKLLDWCYTIYKMLTEEKKKSELCM